MSSQPALFSSEEAAGPSSLPVRCAWRGLVVFDDEGGWRPASDAEIGDIS